ncbi:hypothetical protein CP336_14705 [Pseudomonas fluorescens]|nr:hypothetical protein CP336_14705 [Pseudomonas fluorescens]
MTSCLRFFQGRLYQSCAEQWLKALLWLAIGNRFESPLVRQMSMSVSFRPEADVHNPIDAVILRDSRFIRS